jgi:hypothetical protein
MRWEDEERGIKMPRPRRRRLVRFKPSVVYFKPAGIMLSNLKNETISFDEFEAVRLKDLEQLDQKDAAKRMKISQPTFHRLVLEARKKIANALVNGKSIKIEGGNYKMVQQSVKPGMRRGRGMGGRGRGFSGGGRMGGPFAAGPGGVCKCPKCGYEEPQVRGQPCMNKRCPKCGAQMIRGG